MQKTDRISKYQKWYEELIYKARQQPIRGTYTEIHHIVPRSCGGSDCEANLVTLSYRQHFVAHWLLTKFYRGHALRKMQRAMIAMTLPINGQRIIAGWQFEVTKRAVKDLALSHTQVKNLATYKRTSLIALEYAKAEARSKMTGGMNLAKFADEFLEKGRKSAPPIVLSENPPAKSSRRRQRPSKKARIRAAARRAAEQSISITN